MEIQPMSVRVRLWSDHFRIFVSPLVIFLPSALVILHHMMVNYNLIKGGSRGGAHPAPPPLKLEKIRYFGVKSWIFTRNTPKMFAPPSAIGKHMIYWRKIVIFHTKYPTTFHASLRWAQFFKCAPPLDWIPGSAPVNNKRISCQIMSCTGL
jgi:hypothetical protein